KLKACESTAFNVSPLVQLNRFPSATVRQLLNATLQKQITRSTSSTSVLATKSEITDTLNVFNTALSIVFTTTRKPRIDPIRHVVPAHVVLGFVHINLGSVNRLSAPPD